MPDKATTWAGNDTITYDISSGNDQVFIDGGTGHNTLTIQQNPDDVLADLTVVNGQGQVLYQKGTGWHVHHCPQGLRDHFRPK